MVDTRGGFVLPREGEPVSSASSAAASDASSNAPLRPLSDRQQTRLSAYLDDALTKISRGYLRRHEPQPSGHDADSDWLPTLPALLSAWTSVLRLIVRVPPIGSSAPLLISYLLRATAELTEDITGYNLGEQGEGYSLDAQLRSVIAHLDALDRIWADLIKAHPIAHHQHLLTQLDQALNADTATDATRASQLPGLSTDPSGRFHHAPFSNHEGRPLLHSFPPPSTPASTLHHASTVHSGQLPHAPISQTERIRLRNLVLLGRDRLFRWMRDVLDAPPPPEIEEGAASDGSAARAGKVLGHGSRVAALLDFDQRRSIASEQRDRKRRRVATSNDDASGMGRIQNGGGSRSVLGGGEDDDQALERQERDFAELAGEQGDLDADLVELRDEPVDEPEDDQDVVGVAEANRNRRVEEGEEAKDEIPEMVDVIDEDTGSAAALQQLGTGGDEDGGNQDRDPHGVEGGGEIGREHQHYADLFSRKLDPDASDDDDDNGNGNGNNDDDSDDSRQGRGEQQRSRTRRESNTRHSGTKRAREGSPSNSEADGNGNADDQDSIHSADAHTLDPLTPANQASVVGQWDLEFSRCFRRTLRLLVESDDRAREFQQQQQSGGGDGGTLAD